MDKEEQLIRLKKFAREILALSHEIHCLRIEDIFESAIRTGIAYDYNDEFVTCKQADWLKDENDQPQH